MKISAVQKPVTKHFVLEKIEYSFLSPAATIAAMEHFCNDAKEKNAGAVTVPPLFLKKVKEQLEGTAIKISTVIGYPYGWSAIEAKVAETILAMIDGTDEVEIVVNMLALKNNDWQYLAKELNTLLTVVRKQQKAISFIIEAGLLSKEELTKCCDLYGVAGVDCISLSTGLEADPPSPGIIALARQQLAEKVVVKVIAATLDDTAMNSCTEAGAGRISILVK